MQTTTRGLTYPEDTDHTRIWEHEQDLAETANEALDTLDLEIIALTATVPFAMAAITFNVAGSAAASYSQAFTWPVGRFTQAPMSIATNCGGTGSSAFILQLQNTATTSGGTVLVVHRDNTVTTLTQMVVHVVGFQMTSGSAPG